ncbi:hypothetical protein V6M85_06355 [Sulfolobus tengchongensis]|uniref:Uncharacterized protein n=1 Tax=Sulfolobus tengchongensis TaxID=207809 RepID=A0AAX4L3K1_9CREN
MQDSLGLLAITLVIIVLFSILVGVVILDHENEVQSYNIQNKVDSEIINRAKVGYYWVVEELKNETISFIPHVYLSDTEGVYGIEYVIETTFTGNTFTFPINKLIIFTNGSLTRNGIVLSPGETILIRPNITSGQISFVSTTGNAFSLALLPPSSKTLATNESNENYTTVNIGNESILSLKTSSNHSLGPKNITSVELIYNTTPPLYNISISPSLNQPNLILNGITILCYKVKISYFENVTFIKAVNSKNNKSYLIYPGYGWWNGTVYMIYKNNNGVLASTSVGYFSIYYNTSYNFFKYGPVNFANGYDITPYVKESGYVPLYMILYTYNVTNSSNNEFYKIGKYSQLWVMAKGNNSPVYISYEGYNYSYYYYYKMLTNYEQTQLNPIKVGGSTVYLGYFPLNITVSLVNTNNLMQYNISSFQIAYENMPFLSALPIILNITYNVTSYSPPFLLNFSLTNTSLTIMFNGTPNLPNFSRYIFSLPTMIPINESMLNVDADEFPLVLPFFVIVVNGNTLGENLPIT